jgi:alanyl-tRNA synthetase
LKSSEEDAADRLGGLIEEHRKLERELSETRKKLAMSGAGDGKSSTPLQEIDGIKFFSRTVSGIEMKDLKSLSDEAKQTLGSGVVAIVGLAEDGKAGVVVGVTADLTQRFDAVDLVRRASLKLGGKGGGGRRDLAQGGGPDGIAAEAAIEAIRQALRQGAHAV